MPPVPMSQKQTLTIIWLAMLGAVAAYWMLNLILGRVPKGPAASPLLTQIFILAALVCYGVAWIMYRALVSAVARNAAPANLPQFGQAERLALQTRLQAAAVICLGLLEAPMVLGIVHTVVQGPRLPLFQCAAVSSLAGIILLRLRGFPALFMLIDRLQTPASP